MSEHSRFAHWRGWIHFAALAALVAATFLSASGP